MPFWISVWSKFSQATASEGCAADLRDLLRLWDDLVRFLGEVFLRLEDIPVRHVWLR